MNFPILLIFLILHCSQMTALSLTKSKMFGTHAIKTELVWLANLTHLNELFGTGYFPLLMLGVFLSDCVSRAVALYLKVP